jgi:hypothetical protein
MPTCGLPTLAANPQLNNNTTAGAGGPGQPAARPSRADRQRFDHQLHLYGADGSIRNFQVMTFNNGGLNQTRPYLQTWTDSRGTITRSLTAPIPAQPNFGQMTRIQCSNGNYLGFDYDINGHIH